MFTGCKHKFKGYRHKFKDGKHKFKVGGHKIMGQKKIKRTHHEPRFSLTYY